MSMGAFFGRLWTTLTAHRIKLWIAAMIACTGLIASNVGNIGAPLGGAVYAGDASGGVSDFSDSQKKGIEAVVRSYLLKNPKILLEVEQELKKIVAKEEAEQTRASIAKNADFLFRRANAPIAGNPEGDVPVVEFFDYNCGYCKRSLGDIAGLIEKDPKVKVVFMEYPILSKGSLEASKVALAARMQGKYWEVHRALLNHKSGGIDGKVAMKLAKEQGLDMGKLAKDVESAEVLDEIEKVQEMAVSMDIHGTPHFLVGDRGIAGAPRDLLDQIRKNVSELRKDGCEVC